MIKIISALFFSLLFVSSTVLAQEIPDYVPGEGLEAWYPFNGNAVDETGLNPDGELFGSVSITTDRFGDFNSAYEFDGIDDFIEVSTPNMLNFEDDESFTLNVWFQKYESGAVGNQVIFRKYGCPYFSSPSDDDVNDIVSINIDAYSLMIRNRNDNNSGLDVIAPFPFSDTTWNMITYVKTASELKMYFNGINVASGVYIPSGNGNMANVPFRFGADRLCVPPGSNPPSLTPRHFFHGKIDDFGLWSRELTDEEINGLYQGCGFLSIQEQPEDETVGVGGTVEFTVEVSDSLSSFQWQTDLGVGFQNLSNVGQYNGVTSQTLTVSNVTLSNNNQHFRCVISSGSCSVVSDTAVLMVDESVSVLENGETPEIRIYPNPASTVVTIEHPFENATIEVFNAVGQSVRVERMENNIHQMAIESLPAGIFVVQLEKNGVRIQKKILVKH